MAKLNVPKPDAHLQRNGFDLSRRAVFSAKVGQLLPVFKQETVPNASYEIKPLDILRTLPVNTAAFVRLKQRLDFYFVPYKQLYSKFNEFIAQRADPVSSAYNSSSGSNKVGVTTELPYISLADLAGKVMDDFHPVYDAAGVSGCLGSAKLCNLLGYGLSEQACFSSVSDSVKPTARQFTSAWETSAASQKVNTFPAQAYQKIWADFYRNPYRDTDVNPIIYNDDYLIQYDDKDLANHLSDSVLASRFEMRYVRWKNDLFTSSYPTAQYGSVSTVLPNGSFLLTDPTWEVDEDNFGSFIIKRGSYYEGESTFDNFDVVATDSDDIGDTSISNIGGIVNNNTTFGFSVYDLYRAQAMQHWAENTLRAGNKTKDLFNAHYGVTPRFEEDNHPVYLGGVSSVVDISEVTQVAGGEGETGELFGKGVSTVGNETIRFQSNDFGIIMGVFSIVPETEYPAISLDADVCRLSPFEYYTPEFSKLGFQAVPSKRLNALANTSNGLNAVLGYAPCDYDYKTAVDKVYGNFQNFPLEVKNTSGGAATTEVIEIAGDMSAWVVNRKSSIRTRFQYTNDFYVLPSCVDNVFNVNAGWSETTDQFIINLYCECKAVLPMPVLGLPNY